MKFTNGYWLIRDGIEPHFAAQGYEAEQEGDELVVYAPDHPLRTRGDTLGGVVLTIRYASPAQNVIRVRVSHFEGAINRGPHFELTPDPTFKPEIRVTDNEAALKAGDLTVHAGLGAAWNTRFCANGKVITKNESHSTGYMLDRAKGPFIKDELSLGVGELVYGMGERFGPFIKNGQSVEIWNADGGTASEQAYKNIPFYLTNKGYGVFVNNTGRVSFEVASEKTSRVQFSVPGESLEYFVIYGPSPKQILERYTALTGRPALVPAWTFGLWLSTSFTTNYDEQTVMSFINGMSERGIALSVFHFDCFWMKGAHWCDFVWDDKTFPDPKGLLARIKAKGLKVCVWINPYIAQRSRLFEEGQRKGYFIKKKDGSVFQTDLWQSGMAIVDFTNPEAARWYQGLLAQLVDMGVDSFKTDFGERVPADSVFRDGNDAVYFNNGDPALYHNFYTYLYNKAVFELLEAKKGKGEACVFARSATSGGQKFPVHWGGDCESTFEGMAETLRGGLSLSLSGFGFWSHDIGGFEGMPNAALFKRWLAFGLLSSHSRLHGSSSYRVPWNVDDEAVEVCRFFTKLKASILPYLLEGAKEAHEKGVPLMRAMFLEFPADPVCAYLDRQYMLGPSILVAPIFSPDGEVTYYLPAGTWTSLINGEQREGGRWFTETHGYLSLPLFRMLQNKESSP
ncbi:MAG: alpha-xylosidase [Treponema sp.]|nr:alpha-xylosidase [Treponema sp.]